MLHRSAGGAPAEPALARSEPVSDSLLSAVEQTPEKSDRQPTGILPYQEIRALVRANIIHTVESTDEPVLDSQIQPASLDLRLGSTAHRVLASFLPGTERSIEDKIRQYSQYKVDLRDGAVLERDAVYIVRLLEGLKLPKGIWAQANPKSSAGRLDVFTRLITDGGTAFDQVKPGYHGALYAEISPRAFNIAVRRGTRLGQLRLRRGTHHPNDAVMKKLQDELKLIQTSEAANIYRGKIGVSIDLRGRGAGSVIGYKAKRDTPVIDFDLIDHYDPVDYWEPIFSRPNRGIVLNRGDFYILSSREPVRVPPDYAAEMVAYDTMVGEFRVHYAGFFDPGFGLDEAGGAGSRAVLEVRPHEVPFMVEDGQLVGRLAYEALTQRPDRLYGTGIGSTYQAQGLRLSKHFKQPA